MTALRGLSLLLAAGVGAVALYHPEWTSASAGWAERGALALALIGGVGAAIHGFGHRPEQRLLQFVQSPKVAWPAMLAGVMLFAAQRYI